MRGLSTALSTVLLSALTVSAVLASSDRINIANLGSCVDGRPWDVYVLGADSNTDCDPAPPNGTAEAHCRCMDGVIAALTSGSGSGAPTTLDYFVGTATGSLSAERVGTDTATVDVDLGTAGQVKFNVITPVASASDLSGCTNCIGGTEIDESALVAVPGTRLQSWNNPPASAHSYDDEFDSGSLDAKWTRSSTGTTNPVTTGTIDYTASLTTPITDATSVPSVLMFQSDNSSLGSITITQSYTPATNETHFFKILCNGRNVSTNGEGSFYFFLSNSADNNEFIGFGTSNSGTVHDNWAYVTNNGVQTGTASGSFNEGVRLPAAYLAVWKKGNDYYFGIAGEEKGMWNVYTSKTKTGVTTFDRIGFYFQTANETPSTVEGIDFYRYKASLDYSLVNP